MPLVWAARLRGDMLPERVAGSSPIFSLSAAAAADGNSVYLLGGAEDVPERRQPRRSSRDSPTSASSAPSHQSLASTRWRRGRDRRSRPLQPPHPIWSLLTWASLSRN